jgi:hypothetical protein
MRMQSGSSWRNSRDARGHAPAIQQITRRTANFGNHSRKRPVADPPLPIGLARPWRNGHAGSFLRSRD